MCMDKLNEFRETFVYFLQMKRYLRFLKICSFVNFVTLCVFILKEEVQLLQLNVRTIT